MLFLFYQALRILLGGRKRPIIFDMEKLISILKEQVSLNICKDTEKWGKEYVTLPSRFISSFRQYLF